MQIDFTDEQRQAQVNALTGVIDRRLRLVVDALDAEMIVDELKNSIGVDAYNMGVADAQAYMAAKLTDVGIDVYAESELNKKTSGQVARKPGR